MDIRNAATIADAILREDASDYLWKNPGIILTALNTLDEDGDEDDRRKVERVFDMAPGLMNHDDAGNWVGSVEAAKGSDR